MTKARTPIAQRMGPITSAELESIGVDTIEKLAEMGWRDAFLLWVEAYPERLNVNAAVGLVAAVEGVSWLNVSRAGKEVARALVRALRSARRPARAR